jgi:hypothetical protein
MRRVGWVSVLLVLAGCAAGASLSRPPSEEPLSRDEFRAKILENAPEDAETLVVNVVGSGHGALSTVPGIDLQCESSVHLCWAYAVAGTVVAITATPDRDSVFAAWGGNCSGSGNCRLDMTYNHEVTAVFDPHSVTVVLNGSGKGILTSDVRGLFCSARECTATFANAPPGSMTLQARAAAGSLFAGWFGEGCSGTGACALSTDKARTVLAFFEPVAVSVRVWAPGSGKGTVSAGSATCALSPGAPQCTIPVANTTPPVETTLFATPDAKSVFLGWGGVCSGTEPCNVAANQNEQVTAVFERNGPDPME